MNCRVRTISLGRVPPANEIDQRHNHECEYVLSKKRQSSKKSIGSAPSEKSPESRSQLDEVCNTATDVLVEMPDGAQLSPGLTLSSAGAADTLANESHNSLQGGPSISDDQNTIQTLPDEFGEDATWSIEIDKDNIDNLAPPPTNIRSIQDPNAFSWPLFPTDTDWQFDFDIPLTAENTSASTVASSTALPELDLSPFYSRSTQGFDSTGSSGELIGSLSLNEKVSPNAAFLLLDGCFTHAHTS